MKKIFTFIKAVWFFFFGSLHYTLPPWLRVIVELFRSAGAVIKNQHQHHRKRFYVVLCCLVITFTGSLAAYIWYSNLPQPVRLSVESNTIGPTPLRKDAVPDVFRIEFGGSAARIESVGKVVTSGIRIMPKIEGEWKWEKDDELVFTVKEHWPIGLDAKVEMDKSLFPKHVHLETYKVDLDTPDFRVSISDVSFYQDPRKEKQKKVVAEVHFTHPVDPDSFEDRVKFTFLVGGREKGRVVEKKSVGFKVTYDDYFGKAFLHTDILSIPNYNSRVELVVEKGIRSKRKGPSAKNKLSDTTRVPGMLTHFRFNSAKPTLVRNEKYEPEQVLVISSTAAVKEKDLSEHLEVYVLPVNRPRLPSEKYSRKNYRWHYVNEVSQKVLSLSDRLTPSPIPTPQDYSEIISYKYKEEPGRYLYIRIKKGLTSFGGYRLPDDKAFIAKVPEYPKELKIMAEGSLLSLSGEKKLSILARDLEYVRYRAQRLLPGQIAHFVTQSSGHLGKPSFYEYRFGMENIAETFSKIEPLPITGHGKTQYSHFDFSSIVNTVQEKPKGLYYFVAEGWDKVRNYQTGPSDKRFILITDMGLLAKKSVDGSYDVFVQSVSQGTPVRGAEVQVVGKNGLAVLTRITDKYGHVSFPNLNDFKNERSPVVFVVVKDEDLSFLPINSHVNRINYSRFDIGGVYTRSRSDRLEAYMFSDRGIYRPGEEVNIGYIVKHSDWSRDLSGVNLEMRVVDPKGSTIRRDKTGLNRIGFETYDFQTGETWPTGTYKISLYVIKNKNRKLQIGSTTVKVEEFLPDRMKITARFSRPANKGWIHPDNLQGITNLQNLFGTPAQNRRVKAEISLSPTYPSFYSLKEWHFHDPMRSKKSFSEQLGEKQTDTEGNAVFDLGLEKYESASYMLRFMTEGFEPEGGRSVLASNSVLISPLKYLIGYKPQGDLNYIKKGAVTGVDWIAVDPDLEKISVSDLKMKTLEFRQVSTLVKQPNGTYKYESIKKEYVIKEADFSIAAGGSALPLDTSQPGDFAVAIINKEGLELNRVHYSVAGAANLTFELEKNAELQIKLNKTDFDPGEEIEVSIRSPYIGAGLITIERERVFASKWFETDSNSTVQTIRIPSDLEGNGYVNVTFVRSLASNEIFMSPMSTGIAPFSINKASRINKIQLDVSHLVRPGKDLTMTVSAQKSGKAVVFAVDEGILQVAKYKNPDPLNSFYKKRALEVETRQILDLILPEFSKLHLQRSSEAGGAASLLGKNLNPFKRKRDKSVAYWSGLIDVGPSSKTLTYTVPDYFAGKLRVIAVAVSHLAMDAASNETIVKGHFVLSPNVPTFVAPGDQFKISVGVSNQAEKSGKGAEVNLELVTSKNIDVLEDNTITLNIDEGSETSAVFNVKAREPLGNASFSFIASHQDKEARRTVTSSVRPASPYFTAVQAGYINAGKDLELATPRRMYNEFRNNEITISKLPISLARSFVSYLRKYPYGCTEQVISKGFPSIVLGNYKEFNRSKKEVAAQVQGITEILAARQLPGGGFVKWPGHTSYNVFHTAYAVHYLTKAKDKGYRIPKSLMDKALIFLKEYAEREPDGLHMARVQAYAAYILSRNDIISTKSLTALEKWLEGYEDKSWVKDVMLLYMASSYKIMKADEKAKKLLDRFDHASIMAQDYKYGVFDDTIKRAMHLYLLATHFPKRLSEFDGEKMSLLVESLSSSFNTTSSALSILAFEAYAKQVQARSTEGIHVRQVIDGKSAALTLSGELFPKSLFDPQANTVEIDNTTRVVAYYGLTQAGFDRLASTEKQTSGIEVFREFVNHKGEVIQKINIGEEITVRLKGRSISNDWTSNIVIVDLLPGGFEVVLDSVDRRAGHVEYVDAREDRILIFGNLNDTIQEYEYRIKAVNRGEYEVPPIYAEAMYDRNLRSKGLSQKIIVE